MSIKLAAGPKRVAPAAIERELEALWMSIPPAGDSAAGSMSMRASVANLIAIRDSEQGADEALAVIGKILGANPCRVILATSEPDRDPPEVTADIAILCQKSETCQRCVCCDYIRITGRGIMADNLPSLTASLLAPDLPVAVWCVKPPFSRKDFLALAGLSDRVIVDSAAYACDDIKQLAAFVAKSPQLGTAVSDLNWARLTPYRQMFAQFFDSPECRDHLARIQSIRIEADLAMGRLMAGWLKAQMDKSGFPLPAERVELMAADSKGFSFRSLLMTCSEGQQTFSLIRSDDLTLEARATREGQPQTRIAKAGIPPLDQLLGEEITFSGHDTVFEAALAVAATL